MKLQDVLREFGSLSSVASKIGITRRACTAWSSFDYVPYESQLKIEAITEGRLVADKAHGKRASSGLSISDSINIPSYRYYSDVYGMRDVDVLKFRKNKLPIVMYHIENEPIKRSEIIEKDNLMRSLRIFDIDSRLVFEKDIVQFSDGEVICLNSVHGYHSFCKAYLIEFKVIGNLFETPELMSKYDLFDLKNKEKTC